MRFVNAFKESLKETQGMFNELITPDVTQFEEWNIGTIVLWISGLDNGRYRNYIEQMRNALVALVIERGEHLPDLNESILSIEPFDIKSFPDKRDLVSHFKGLIVSNDHNDTLAAEDVSQVAPSADYREDTKTAKHIDR